jgi:hypothetical protein
MTLAFAGLADSNSSSVTGGEDMQREVANWEL